MMVSTRYFFIWSLLAIGTIAQVQSIQTSQTPTTSRTPDQLSSAIAALPTPTDCSQIQPGTQNISVCWFTIGNIPTCAHDCLQRTVLQYIPCQTTDLACLCMHNLDIQTKAVPCLLQSCSTNDIAAVVNYYLGLCQKAGLTLQGQSSSSGSASASTSAASTLSTATQAAQATETMAPPQITATDQGLSTGAKAGIGVGVSLGILMLLGIVAFLLLRRKRRQIKPIASPEGQSRRKSSATLVSAYPKDHERGSSAYQKALPRAPGTPVAEMEDVKSPPMSGWSHGRSPGHGGNRPSHGIPSPAVELDSQRRGKRTW